MTCPTCGRPEPEFRCGVYLPRIKAHVFDAVKAASDIGITTRQLMRIIYGGKVKRSTATIRNHIQQINDKLAGTDWYISCRDRRHWLLAEDRPLPPLIKARAKKEGEEYGKRDSENRTQRVRALR